MRREASAGRRALAELAERWIRVGWQEGDAEALARLHAADFVDHSPSGRDSGVRGFTQGVRALYAAFPDFSARIEDLVIEEPTGRIAIRWSATGTHNGVFEGIQPTRRPVAFSGIEIIVVREGLIRERWGEWNGLEQLAQLRSKP